MGEGRYLAPTFADLQRVGSGKVSSKAPSAKSAPPPPPPPSMSHKVLAHSGVSRLPTGSGCQGAGSRDGDDGGQQTFRDGQLVRVELEASEVAFDEREFSELLAKFLERAAAQQASVLAEAQSMQV